MAKVISSCMCIHCPFRKRIRTSGCVCSHPDQRKIDNYFKEHNISKMPGFIGFIKSDGSFPVKTTPKWCPKIITEDK